MATTKPYFQIYTEFIRFCITHCNLDEDLGIRVAMGIPPIASQPEEDVLMYVFFIEFKKYKAGETECPTQKQIIELAEKIVDEFNGVASMGDYIEELQFHNTKSEIILTLVCY